MPHDILDDLFHACAWHAFIEQARIDQAWPDCETTRRRAFRLYEEAIADRAISRLQAPKVEASWVEATKEGPP